MSVFKQNILFLGGGRRVELAKLFKSAGYNVYSYELSRQVPVSSFVPVIQGKPWNDTEIKEHLKEIVESHRVRAIIPLDDSATVLLASIASQLNCASVVSPYPATNICYDKLRFASFMEIFFPEIYPSKDKVWWNNIAKPRFGNGSKGIRYLRYEDEEIDENKEVEQLCLKGDEFSVDAYFNLDGDLVGASPRKRIRTAGGEVIESVTVDRPDLVKHTETIGLRLGLKGPACLQFMEDSLANPYIIEINARFGGGATLSVEAGLDLIHAVTTEYIWGMKVLKNSMGASSNIYMCRYFTDVFFNRNLT